MTMLVSEATIELDDAPRRVAALCELLARQDVAISEEGGAHVGRFASGTVRIVADGERVGVRIEAFDLTAMNGIKLECGSNLSYLCGRELDIVWSGDLGGLTRPPKLCVLTVLSVETLTPHMRRIVFSGDNLARFADETNLHVRLALPKEGAGDVAMPMVDGRGRMVWPEGGRMPDLRKYTVRRIDLAAATVSVDFAIHAEAGPGSRFGETAKPGDVIGMIGPGGRGALPADWYLLAGDETALPAIGRILEGLPASTRGVALIEVADPSEEQRIETAAGIELRWLHRNGAAPGTTTLLADAVRAVEVPRDGTSVFAWAAGEFDAFKAIRSHLRRDRGLRQEQHLVVSYWRRGRTEDELEAG